MTQDEDLAQPENVSVTPVTSVVTESPIKAKWLKAINDQNRMQLEGGVQLTVTPEGKLNFMGDPSATKQGKALEATLNEAFKAGVTVAEIAESINNAKQPAAVTPVAVKTPDTVGVGQQPVAVSPESEQANAHKGKKLRLIMKI
jgi:hypothetical protein